MSFGTQMQEFLMHRIVSVLFAFSLSGLAFTATLI